MFSTPQLLLNKFIQQNISNIHSKNTVMFLQPQIMNNKVIGAEALVRMKNSSKIISPADFITIAENMDKIHKIDMFILDKACQQLKNWNDQDMLNHITISCNMSMKTIEDADFVSSVKNAINTYSINPKLLKLETTETILVKNIQSVLLKLMEIQKLGISISLDDFGTGNSSLSYLKDFPINQLKIDKSFIDNVLLDSKHLSIVKFIIGLTKELSIDLIVEGVENQLQVDLLQNIGCNIFQGYHYGKPMKVKDFEYFLTAN